MKIRTKAIIFLTSIILITGIIVSIANQIISKNIIKEQIRMDLESTAQSRAHNVETFLNNHIELTEMISTGNLFMDIVDERVDFLKTSAQIKRRVLSFINGHPEIDRIRILDKNGIVVVDSYNDTAKNLSKETVYIKGKESSYIGDINRSLNSGNLDICISNPIFVRNIFSGVLIINFDIEKTLFGIVENKTGLGETGEIYLINRNAYMITPSRFLNNVILKQKVLTPESYECWELSGDEEEKEREDVDVYQSYHGEQVIGTHYRIKGTDCCLLAEINLKQALAPIRDLTIISIIILIVLVVLIISISLPIVTSITKPIRKLHIGVDEILRGNLDYKVATKSEDEIGQLSRAFDDMSTKLIKSKNELENHAVKLEKDVDERTVELKKHFQKSEEQRIATLSVLSDLNEITKNLKLEIIERKRAEQIQKVLYNISNAIITTENFDELIKRIQEELGTIVDTANFYIALYDNKTDTISLPFFKDEKDAISSFPAGKTLTQYVIRTKKSLLATKKKITILEKSGDIESIGSNSEIWLGVPFKVEGKVTGVIAVQSYTDENAYDESDKKILEFVSHQISISIERKKAEEDLKLALENAQESDRLKSAFLSNMSHEIRTPMNGILGFTSLLKEPQLSGEEMNKYIRIIEKSGNRMLSTINDIVDISRIEAGQVDVINTKISLNKIFEEQYNFFNIEAEAKGLELVCKSTISDKEANIITDKHKLEGILTNLIKNAIKFTDHGHISFGCSIKKEKDADVLEFYVKDTGIGIPSDRIEAIFNRFEQADIEDVRVYEGSGLGLAISKSYVEMLGGNIKVTSEAGLGSTFTFTIPCIWQSTKENDIEGSPKIDKQVSLKNFSVIIAEDDEASRLLLEAVFENKFQEIIYTKTGKETLDRFRENPEVNIILMDLKMPIMSGFEVTCEIRKFNREVIIIAQTAFGLLGDKEKALEAGCDDYIAKPINTGLLFEKIMFHLSKKTTKG